MKLTEITIDEDLQTRVGINEETVNEYTEAIREGARFPAITVFHDGTSYFLADGWHRYFAHKKAGLNEIDAKITKGTRRSALEFAAGANKDHGLPLTNADKRKGVMIFLDDVEWSGRSDREIASITGASRMLVARMRKEISNPSLPKPTTPKEDNSFVDNVDRSNNAKPNIEYAFEDQEDDKIKELSSTIEDLSKDLEQANQRIAIAAYEATDEEKMLVENTLLENQNKINALELEVRHLKSQNMVLVNKENEYKKQIKLLEKQIFAMRKQYETA